MKNQTTVERKSDRELVSTRTINGPIDLVFEAWTTSALFQRWWVPKSFPISLQSCEMDVRVGGKYRLGYSAGEQIMDFFGTYLEVVPCSRLVWTNDEGGADAVTITTVTFEQRDGNTLLTMHDLHPSKNALDETIESGACSGTAETLDQLEELVVSNHRSIS